VTIDPRVFKAYDVRGLYPEEVDEDGAERIGAAFIALTGAKRVAVGHDVREQIVSRNPRRFFGLAPF